MTVSIAKSKEEQPLRKEDSEQKSQEEGHDDEWSLSNDGWEDLASALQLGLPITFSQTVRFGGMMLITMLYGREKTSLLAGITSAQVWCDPLDEFMKNGGTQTATLVAQAIGAGNKQLAGTWLQMMLILVTVLSIPTVLIKMMTGPMLYFVGAQDEIAHSAGEFAFNTSFIMVIELYIFALGGFLNGQRIFKPEFIVCCISLVVNTTIVYYLTAVAHVGIFGVAMSVNFRRLFHLSALVIGAYAFGAFEATWKAPRMSELFVKERWLVLLSQTIPAGLDSAIQKMSTSITLALAARMGMAQTAAYDILMQLTLIQAMIVWAMTQGFSITMAQRLGASQPRRAKGIILVGMLFMYSLLGVFACAFYFGLSSVAHFASHDPEVISEMESMTMFLTFNCIFSGALGMVMDVVVKQGKPEVVMITIAPCVWLLGLPISLLLAPHLELRGIFWGSSIGYGLAHAILFLVVMRSDWATLSQRASARSEAKEV